MSLGFKYHYWQEALSCTQLPLFSQRQFFIKCITLSNISNCQGHCKEHMNNICKSIFITFKVLRERNCLPLLGVSTSLLLARLYWCIGDKNDIVCDAYFLDLR